MPTVPEIKIKHVTSCYSRDVRDTANVIAELLSAKSCCMELSVLSNAEMDLCMQMHQLWCVL